MEEQSDTPRTDAAVKYGIVDVGDKWTGTNPLGMDVVDVETSRDLERELATATRERDEARAEVERLRSALVDLVNQILKCGPVDELGHRMTMNRACLEAETLLDSAATEAARKFCGVGELERTGYIPAGSADEREAKP